MTGTAADYPHIMLKEIREQPAALARALSGRLQESGGRFLLEELKQSPAELQALQRVEIVACGSSRYAGMIGEYFLESLGRLPVRVHAASEFRARRLQVDRHCLVVAISQSGETADTLGAVHLAREQGAQVAALVNTPGSAISNEAQSTLLLQAGQELGVPSTKAFTNTVLTLQLLALYLGHCRGTVAADEVRARLAELQELPRLAGDTLGMAEQVRQVATRYLPFADFLFLGRGTNYPLALEGALKLKEVSYVHAEGMAAGELRHGPLAMIDDQIPVVALATRAGTYEKTVADLQEVKARAGKVLAIVSQGDDAAVAHADDVLVLPLVSEWQSPVVNAIPLQLFAYYSALLRQRDVDHPRHLTKAVTNE